MNRAGKMVDSLMNLKVALVKLLTGQDRTFEQIRLKALECSSGWFLHCPGTGDNVSPEARV